MKKKIALVILIYLLGVITIPVVNKVKEKKLDNDVMYKVTINQKYINVRPDIDLGSKVLTEVLEGETYEVVDYYEGNKYNWYKIRFGKRATGWIASDKIDSWVTINEED